MKDYLYSLATDRKKGMSAGILKILLFALSLIYGFTVQLLVCFWSIFRRRINCKVISVGNITLGGTGKTSLVRLIAQYLKTEGHKVAVLSRGYKRGKEAMGDEPYMLKQGLKDIPVMAGPDRIKLAKAAIKKYSIDTVILDDAFQQWKIKKDLEIVTIDATNPFGNRHLLPRGILRQPISALKRGDIFVLTKTNLAQNSATLKEYLQRINPTAPLIESMHLAAGIYPLREPDHPLDISFLKEKNVVLFSGIGDPASFESLIKNAGASIQGHFKFSDHHNYTKEELEKIASSALEKNSAVITTEKDAARILESGLAVSGQRIFVLRIALKLKDEQGFYTRLLKLYSL